MNGDDIKSQAVENKSEETEESESKDRIIKLDDVESLSQTEVIFYMFVLNNDFELIIFHFLENTNES